MGTRQCKTCGVDKLLSDFLRGQGSSNKCKDCRNAHNRRYRATRVQQTKETERKNKFKVRYGITLEEYDDLLKSQGGCCAVCGKDYPGRRVKHFSVDHCHATSMVRGLLCDTCNRGLGMLGDTLDSINKAIEYLRRNG